MRIGLISDTHGLLRPAALAALSGCDRLIHAGDIGGVEIVRALEAVAPLTCVRGNNDHGDWAASIPETQTLDLDGVRIHVLHDLARLGTGPHGGRWDVVVTGHSHQPKIARRDGVHFINSGSAGPRRFRLPVTVALLEVVDAQLTARIVELEV